MAHVYKIKYGHPAAGWSYIDLTDYYHGIVDYVPGTPVEGADDITESGVFRIANISISSMISAIEAIEDVFHQAKEYDDDPIGVFEVWLTLQVSGGDGSTWESQIFEGRVELPADTLGANWSNNFVEATIIWRRTAWWRCSYAIYTTNANQTIANVNAPHVFNNNDQVGANPNIHTNSMDIAVPLMGGDMRAPAMFRFNFTGGSAIDKVLILHNAKANPGNFPATFAYHFEGETGSGDTGDGTRSNSLYHTYVIPAGTSGSNIQWSTNPAAYGFWIRCLISAKFSGTVKVRPYLLINGVFYYGPTSIVSSGGSAFELSDLGMLKCPSIDPDMGGYNLFNSISYGINVVCAAGINFSLDYVEFPPVDSFAAITLDSGLNSGEYLYVNSLTGQAFGMYSNGLIKTMATMVGGIYLEPNMTQRLYFKFSSAKVDDLAIECYPTITCWQMRKTL